MDRPGVCALHEFLDVGIIPKFINPGCPTNQWQFCQYDWKSSQDSAWLCTMPDHDQCPSFSTVNPTNASFVSSEVSGGDSDTCPTFTIPPPNGENGGNAPLTCTYNIYDFTPTALNQWADYDWEQCPGITTTSATANINTIVPTLCMQTASSQNPSLVQYCPVGETDCTLSELVNDPPGWGNLCTNGVVPPDDDSSSSLLLILLVGGLLLLIIGGIPIAAIIFFLILKK